MTESQTTTVSAYNTLADIRLAASKVFAEERFVSAVSYNFNLGGGKTIVVWVDRDLVCWDHNPADC